MASEPLLPLLGSPSLEPGWLEITAPALGPLPPLLGGARFEPASRGAPRPAPLRPKPDPVDPEPPPTEGGGGTILFASNVPRGVPAPPPVLPLPRPAPDSEGGGATTFGPPSVGAAEDESDRVPEPPDIPVEGGGAITFGPRVEPMPLRVPCGLPALAPTVGGGGTTFAASEVVALPPGLFE
jgi:hypothetical protein